MADRFGLTLLILYPFLLSVSTEGRNFLNFDHRGSSSPGHGEELARRGGSKKAPHMGGLCYRRAEAELRGGGAAPLLV